MYNYAYVAPPITHVEAQQSNMNLKISTIRPLAKNKEITNTKTRLVQVMSTNV